MARQYKLEVKYDGVVCKAFIHDDNSIEMDMTDQPIPIQLLNQTISRISEMLSYMRVNDVKEFEIKKI